MPKMTETEIVEWNRRQMQRIKAKAENAVNHALNKGSPFEIVLRIHGDGRKMTAYSESCETSEQLN